MKLLLMKKDKLEVLVLPSKVDGNYWLEDVDDNGNKRKLINVEEYNGKWKIKSNFETKIIANGKIYENVLLNDYCFYPLQINGEKNISLVYSAPVYDNNVLKLKLLKQGSITVGNDQSNDIIYKSNRIGSKQIKLTLNNNSWTIENLNNNCNVYINNLILNNNKLNHGDSIFIMGLKIVVLGDKIIINNPNNLVTYNFDALELSKNEMNIDIEEEPQVEDETELQMYDKNEYFFRAPRFRTTLEVEKINIDPPTQKGKEEEMPLIYTLGPMLTMGMTSMITGITALNSVLNKQQSLSSAMPSLVIAGAMLLSMIVWPMLSKKYQNKQKKQREKLRQEKYRKYIDSQKEYIVNTINKQRQILLENNLCIEKCKEIIEKKDRNLWERKIEHDDFLKVRLGLGSMEPSIEISYPEQHFSLEEDNLRNLLDELGREVKTMHDVPISVNFTEKYVSAVVGKKELTTKFLKGLILKTITFHSYEDLKIVLFTNKNNAKEWEFLKDSPYCWNDEKTVRFFGTDSSEINQVSNYLQDYINSRQYKNENSNELNTTDYKSYIPYFLVITDDFAQVRNIEFIKSLVSQKINYGFSLIINNEKLLGLPNECSLFINIDEKSSGVFENELIANKQKQFFPDIDNNDDIEKYCQILSNIPIELDKEKYFLPKSLSFLEMYNVGMVEQLNSLKRWKDNNPITSLQAPVGVNENGELFELDLHEKFHGPHGLVAGMTGSGKSEFIITYILSMAVNYHPDEVSFALIDYKGGGLAGAFENKETGVVLPHLCGTITNLDTVEMKRSLASIQSELKRRQRVFNKARELTSESTIDIYKYQKLYREGIVKEPVPHLFIISDEFAELKTQQPEFMEQLISTARIGRSLGVHLILATQKPSGVVDDQIWSNSKFRVCLKVQDKSDSNDMIKCPDAAGLKNVGRFYLQVGYNEFFALGQSAWCGAPYLKTEKLKKKIDSSVNFVNNTGYVIKSIDGNKTSVVNTNGEELPNIVKYLTTLAEKEGIHQKKLWLDKIPEFIYCDELEKKYSYQSQPHVIDPIIGEYDNPSNQSQHLLILPLSNDGNTIIYGAVGTGKENLLSTIIYSTIIKHDASEVNFYAIDCGAETLKIFKDAPQIGDILLSSETEKIENMFKMLKEELDERKKLFADYNGNYQTYCNKSGKVIPTIVVIINYYEIFSELYPDYEDITISLTREGLKYGIIFILTTTGVNSIRYKISQNFKQQLVLQLNDDSDYTTVLGSVHGTYPSKIKGRGLIKQDDIFEFQAAYPCEIDKQTDFIKDICSSLKQKANIFSKSVPILPEVVTLDIVKPYLKDLTSIPIGIKKEDLSICTYNFENKYINLISTTDINNFYNFLPPFMKEIASIKGPIKIIIDSDKLFNDIVLSDTIYYKNNFDEAFNRLEKYITKINEVLEKNNNDEDKIKDYQKLLCIIIGMDSFKNKISSDNNMKLQELFENGKKNEKVNFIFVDSIDNIKNMEYDGWFKTCVSVNSGIWLGDSLSEQYTIKLSKTPKFVRETFENNFGCYINKGIPELIKLISEDDENE